MLRLIAAGRRRGAAGRAGPAAPRPKPTVAAKDAKVWAAAEAARPEQLKLLQQVVNIDSGTGDVEGGRKVAAVLVAAAEGAGLSPSRACRPRPRACRRTRSPR